MFGGSDTKRGKGLARFVTLVGEMVGLLNKGSANAEAAPGAGDADKVTPVSSNTLNVTRVTGVVGLITACGAAALGIFGVSNGPNAKEAVVAAAYAATGLIVAAALIMVALIMVADIHSRQRIATATGKAAPVDKGLKLVNVRNAVHKDNSLELDAGYSWYELDATNAAEGNETVQVHLPTAKDSPVKPIELRRSDDTATHVEVQVNGATPRLAGNRPMVLYVDENNRWHQA